MQISALFIRVVFLVFPGILGSKLYRKLRGATSKKVWEDFVEILLFAVASYLVWAIVRVAFNAPFGGSPDVRAFEAFFDERVPIAWSETVAASAIAILLGILAAYAHRDGTLYRCARAIRASNRTGDEDIWWYFFTRDLAKEWVFVRDHKLSLCYYGWIHVYSDSREDRELILMDVEVYDNANVGDLLYKRPAMYIARAHDDLTIEIPALPEKQEAKDEQDEDHG